MHDTFNSKAPALLLLAGLAEAISLPTIHLIATQSGLPPKAADTSIFILVLLFTAALLVYARTGARHIEQVVGKQTPFWAGLSLLAILLFSASIITVYPGAEGRYWFGYGPTIAMLSVLFIPVLIAAFSQDRPKLDLVLSVLTYGIALAVYLPSILQPPWGVIGWGHSQYVLNELLAPQTGSYPLVNFSAQYTSLLGYVFNLLFQSRGTIDQAVWFLTILALCTILFSLAPIVRAFPKGKGYLAIILAVPAIFIVKPHEDAYSGSLAGLFSAIPIRLLFPALVALLISWNPNRRAKPTGYLAIGLVCSIGILNNFESGLVSTIAALTVIALDVPGERVRRLMLSCAGAIAFLALAHLTLQWTFGRPHLHALMDFVGGFGGGFGAVPMPSFGLWVLAIVFLSMNAVVAALYLHATGNEGARGDDNTRRVAALVLFWGLFGIGMSPYYFNRSVVSGQLQFILFSVFLSSAGLFLLIARTKGGVRLKNMALIVATLPGAISGASLIQHPSFALARERLSRIEHPVSDSYKSPIDEVRDTVNTLGALPGGGRIGLFTDFGSLLAAPLSLPSYLPVNNQADLNVVRRSMAGQICLSLERDRIAFLISYGRESQTLPVLQNCGYHLYLRKLNQQVYVR